MPKTRLIALLLFLLPTAIFAQVTDEWTAYVSPLGLHFSHPADWVTLEANDAQFVIVTDSTTTQAALGNPLTDDALVIQIYTEAIAAEFGNTPADVLTGFQDMLFADAITATENTDGITWAQFEDEFGTGLVLTVETVGGSVALLQAQAATVEALTAHTDDIFTLAQSVVHTIPVPALAQSFNGGGRLANVDFAYPDGWHTLGGIPVNRMVSFNVVSSVPIGIRNQVQAGEEAVIMAIAGGRVDRWNTIADDATPEAILTAFFEQLGNDNNFNRSEDASGTGEFEQITEAFTTANGYEAVRVRFVEVNNMNEEMTTAETATDEAEFSGDFVAYSLRLDDKRFMVVLVLLSEYQYAEAAPLLDAMLATLEYSP